MTQAVFLTKFHQLYTCEFNEITITVRPSGVNRMQYIKYVSILRNILMLISISRRGAMERHVYQGGTGAGEHQGGGVSCDGKCKCCNHSERAAHVDWREPQILGCSTRQDGKCHTALVAKMDSRKRRSVCHLRTQIFVAILEIRVQSEKMPYPVHAIDHKHRQFARLLIGRGSDAPISRTETRAKFRSAPIRGTPVA